MFEFDPLTLAVCRKVVLAGWHRDGRLSAPEVAHVAIALSHSEAQEDHDLNLKTLFPQLLATCPPGQVAHLQGHAHMARKHAAEIARFGRFPHRNQLLGRTTTAEEAAWLNESQYGYHKQVLSKKADAPA